MNTELFQQLLYRLCVDLGFCLPREAASDLASFPPVDARRATDAVFRAEGLDPVTADQQIYRQVHAMVSEAYYGDARPVELDSSAPDVVTIVLDSEYGDRLDSLDRGAVWIVGSPTNQPVAHEIGRRDQSRSITTFSDLPGLSAWESLARILPDVELHHGAVSQDPPFRRIEVIGCRVNDAGVQTLEDFGFEVEQPTVDGFVARRSSLPSDDF